MEDSLINKLQSYTVLYVEDEDGIRINIQEILNHLFKETHTATNAKEAYVSYLKNKPDLIITDIKMSGESGIDLIKKIRKADSKTRVIITSAHTDLEFMLEAAELHLVKYIIKPITNDKLIDALKSFVKTHENDRVYHLAENWIYDSNKSIVVNEKETIKLTRKESTFLKLLVSKDRIISYEEIENIVWTDENIMTANAMRLFIKNLRKKLPKNSLKNIQSTGYRFIKE